MVQAGAAFGRAAAPGNAHCGTPRTWWLGGHPLGVQGASTVTGKNGAGALFLFGIGYLRSLAACSILETDHHHVQFQGGEAE